MFVLKFGELVSEKKVLVLVKVEDGESPAGSSDNAFLTPDEGVER